ncbi:hypothetical protein PHYSODRAFT_260488 [Phytophthora sojae]|uniref:TNFR-Cys domain-containing protein n=1 Tax=Phytophthora sojae (strain P6497) TaxID=1094619 RepID=G4YKI8_PHYSP|nr:hypothetical protein PHYSODRAFT_260488 [Phytophthora sojae]EGZ28568.1 hypothetical protein PHYSODRAFT_260488 [Phytophthora sojae]|eukprot:XP_009515843.1 hypothetical protein PHYSODRAFT_260488 [Phytophthora sojae]
MATSTLHVLAPSALLLLLPDVHAQSSSASSASVVGDVSEVSTTNMTDTCGQDEYSNDCWYPVSCKGCLARTGCAVEVSTGQCVSSSSSVILDADTSSISYFLSGEVEYCRATDPACFSCRRGNAPAVCFGSSDCVCVSQCERLSTQATKCLPSSMGGLSSASLIAAVAVILPLVTYLIFKGSPCSSSCSISRWWRRRKDKTKRNLPGGLKLDAWRNHLNERAEPVDEQFADLELRSCFVPMNSVRHQPHSAETGGVHVEAGTDTGDVARAVAATDLPLSPTAHRSTAAAADQENEDGRCAATELV